MSHVFTHLIFQSDEITYIVLFILCLLSVIGWSIFLYKMILFAWKKHTIKKVLLELPAFQTEKEFSLLAQTYKHSLVGSIIMQTRLYQENASSYTYQELQSQQEYILDQLLQQEESMISFLSMSAAIAPLLGLFGTVWGLVNSFMSIGMQQSADIATVAPGIAQALITTLIGLCVAIPAVAFANYLHAQIRSLEQLLSEFSQKLIFTSVKQKQHKGEQCVCVVADKGMQQSVMSH